MEGLLLDADNGDRGVVVMGSGFTGGFATQHNPLEAVALWWGGVTPEPPRFDYVSVGGGRILLVLSGKDPAADLTLQLLDCRGAVALRLQQFPRRTVIDFVLANLIVGRFDSDGGQHQLGPALLDQDAGEVVDMEP